MSRLRLAAPSSTFRARDANSREHLVSPTFSTAGLQLTNMTHLLLPPRESSSRRVSWWWQADEKGQCQLVVKV